jgi:hypothetical protein
VRGFTPFNAPFDAWSRRNLHAPTAARPARRVLLRPLAARRRDGLPGPPAHGHPARRTNRRPIRRRTPKGSLRAASSRTGDSQPRRGPRRAASRASGEKVERQDGLSSLRPARALDCSTRLALNRLPRRRWRRSTLLATWSTTDRRRRWRSASPRCARSLAASSSRAGSADFRRTRLGPSRTRPRAPSSARASTDIRLSFKGAPPRRAWDNNYNFNASAQTDGGTLIVLNRMPRSAAKLASRGTYGWTMHIAMAVFEACVASHRCPRSQTTSYLAVLDECHGGPLRAAAADAAGLVEVERRRRRRARQKGVAEGHVQPAGKPSIRQSSSLFRV